MGFGSIWDASWCYNDLVTVIRRVGEVTQHAENDGINVVKYANEVAAVTGKLGRLVGRRLEDEDFGFMSMCSAGCSMGRSGDSFKHT